MMRYLSVRLVITLVLFALFMPAADCDSAGAVNERDHWYLTCYGGAVSADTIIDVMSGNADYGGSYNLIAAALGREIGRFGEHVSFELEGQAVKHFGGEDYLEFNGVIVGRWQTFPWKEHVKTSVAVGEGLSYATDIPEVERKDHNNVSRLLNYLSFETAFSLPEIPQWSLIVRLHHRSGVFGLFKGVYGASNALCAGIRYDF